MRMTITFNRHSVQAPLILGLVLAALATVVGVGPALAGTTSSDYGSTVKCNYRTSSPGPAFTAGLKRIIVAPPKMFAKSGQQTVGWRFIVRRTIDEGDYPSHHVTYRSPIQTATATTVKAADFESMRVDVALPKNIEDPRNVFYEVVIRMIWYRPDGSVKSTISYLMPDYTVRVRGDGWAYTEGGYETCEGVQWAAV